MAELQIMQETADSAVAGAVDVPLLACVFEGSVGGFLSDPSRFCLRIKNDGTLEGEVWRRRPTPRPTVVALANGHKKQRIEADEVKTEGLGSSHLESDFVLIAHVRGNALIDPASGVQQVKTRSADAKDLVKAEDTAEQLDYCCSFDVSKRAGHIDRHAVHCHLHLPAAAQAGATTSQGKWSMPYRRQADGKATESTDGADSSASCDASGQMEQDFQLTMIDPNAAAHDAESKPLRKSLLYPLRPGKYDFRGFTTYETPSIAPTPRRRGRRRATPAPITRDECIVSLRLLPDGTLSGTSRELVYPQVCTLFGNWQINRVTYVLEYKVRDAVGHFRYSGGVDTTSERDTLRGKWRNVDEGNPEGYEGGKGEFELDLVHAHQDMPVIKHEFEHLVSPSTTSTESSVEDAAAVKRSDEEEEEDCTIAALTAGRYTLKGRATDNDGYEYGFELALVLLPDGKLVGTTRELVFEQTRGVIGTWTRSSIQYDQDYVVRHEIGKYAYGGELGRDGVVVDGTWQNAEPQFATMRGEHGTFALAITSADRHWTLGSHRDFPVSFKRSVQCILLCCARKNMLPVTMWTHILAFCHESWFVRTRKAKEE